MESTQFTYFYKYRKVDKYTIQALKNNELYFSLPANFNDPFDCMYLPDDQTQEIEEAKKSFSEEFETFKKSKDWSNKWDDRLGCVGEIMMEQFYNKHISSAVDNRVFCLSEINNDTLLWSHYADSHRGICFIFKAEVKNGISFLGLNSDSFNYRGGIVSKGRIKSKKNKIIRNHTLLHPVHKVQYQKKVPKILNFYKNLEGKSRFITFEIIKDSSWSYEKEARITINSKLFKENPVKFDKNYFGGIIFGLKTNKKDIITIKDIMQKYYVNEGIAIKFYLVNHINGSYNLSVSEITNIDLFIQDL